MIERYHLRRKGISQKNIYQCRSNQSKRPNPHFLSFWAPHFSRDSEAWGLRRKEKEVIVSDLACVCSARFDMNMWSRQSHILQITLHSSLPSLSDSQSPHLRYLEHQTSHLLSLSKGRIEFHNSDENKFLLFSIKKMLFSGETSLISFYCNKSLWNS